MTNTESARTLPTWLAQRVQNDEMVRFNHDKANRTSHSVPEWVAKVAAEQQDGK